MWPTFYQTPLIMSTPSSVDKTGNDLPRWTHPRVNLSVSPLSLFLSFPGEQGDGAPKSRAVFFLKKTTKSKVKRQSED
jgi:hypothetical protein